MPKKVEYNIAHQRVCEEHNEFGPIVCCPFPGCSNGTETDEIETSYPGLSEKKVFRRFEWTDNDGHKSYSWEGDLPVWFQISRVFWREAQRKGLLQWEPSSAPATIYHYTTPEGLLGIIESNEFWMTDYSYLNDAQELTYGFNLAKIRFGNVAKSRPEASDMLYRWASIGDEINARICMGSFSCDGDSLSQWRAYGPIAIGFEPGAAMFGYNNSVQLHKVVYELEKQEQLLDLFAHLSASAYEGDKASMPSDKHCDLYYDGTDRMIEIVSTLKHPAFSDEREIRLVHIENFRVYDHLSVERTPQRFRVSTGALVPFVSTRDLATLKDSYPEKLPIREVIVGPTEHAEVLEKGVSHLLKARGYDDVVVTRSVAPFR